MAKIGGDPAPDNPLLVYEAIFHARLVTEREAAFIDGRGGRIVMLDLIDGSGWEVDDGGGDGPGEFSGLQPFLSEADGLILTASQRAQAATWSRQGELISATRYPEFVQATSERVVGLLRSGVAVTHRVEVTDFSREGRQSRRQAVTAYSPVEGRLWAYELRPMIKEVKGDRASSVAGHGFMIDARLGTIAFVQDSHRDLVVLNTDGSLRERVKLPYEAHRVLIDANERLWVWVYAKNEKAVPSWLVYDPGDLSAPPRRVAEQGVQDARGSYLLTQSLDSLGLNHLHLLRERDGG